MLTADHYLRCMVISKWILNKPSTVYCITKLNQCYTFRWRASLHRQIHCFCSLKKKMTASNGNIFRVTGLLCGESTGHRWIPLTKASDVELWCFVWCAPEQTVKQTIDTPMISDATPSCSLWRHCNATYLGEEPHFIGRSTIYVLYRIQLKQHRV